MTTPPSGITSDLDSLINKIKAKDGERSKNLEWTNENLNNIWNAYQERVKSASTRAALRNVILGIEGKDIVAKVPSQLIREKIIAEKGLQIDLRSNFHDDLSIKYIVDLDLFPDYQTIPVKKILTDEEKYKIMLEKNPNLEKLVTKFNLRLDKK